MNIKEMITEWRKGCSCGPINPSRCEECTNALIDAIEKKVNSRPVGGEAGSGYFIQGISGRGGGNPTKREGLGGNGSAIKQSETTYNTEIGKVKRYD